MSKAESSFSHRLRVRVCGLLVEQGQILLMQVHSPVTGSLIWTPPGGGLQFGEQMKRCLQREFLEETNLQVEVQNLLHINELIDSPFHALEFYFEVDNISGDLELGHDPELSWNQQLIRDIQWIPIEKLKDIDFAPESLLPKIFDWEQRSSFRVFEGK